MTVLVDTPIWSRAYRYRSRSPHDAVSLELAQLIRDQRAELLGPVRQELLSGVKQQKDFHALRSHLRAFVDFPLDIVDYEQAARYFTQCREKGIQGSQTDFLICAVANRWKSPIFTTDQDFTNYAKHLDISLHPVAT